MVKNKFFLVNLLEKDVTVYTDNDEKVRLSFQKGVICDYNDVVAAMYRYYVGKSTIPFERLFKIIVLKYLGKKYVQNLIIRFELKGSYLIKDTSVGLKTLPFEVDFNFEISNSKLKKGNYNFMVDKLLTLANKKLNEQVLDIDNSQIRLYKFDHIVAEALFKSVRVKKKRIKTF